VSSLWGEAVNCWRLALSEADDLAVGRGDDERRASGGKEMVEMKSEYCERAVSTLPEDTPSSGEEQPPP
jgi:hypothetical protein